MLATITKSLIAALVLTSAVVASAQAAPQHETQNQAEKNWMDHASQSVDGGGY